MCASFVFHNITFSSPLTLELVLVFYPLFPTRGPHQGEMASVLPLRGAALLVPANNKDDFDIRYGCRFIVLRIISHGKCNVYNPRNCNKQTKASESNNLSVS